MPWITGQLTGSSGHTIVESKWLRWEGLSGRLLSFSVFLSSPSLSLSLSFFLLLMRIYGCFHPGFTTPSLSYPTLPPYCYHLSLHSLSCHFFISFLCNTFTLHLNDSIISLLKMMRIVICSFLLHFFILFPSILGR